MSITDDLIDKCARAAYETTVGAKGVPHERWDNLQPRWRETFRIQARAILEVVDKEGEE